MPRLYAFHPGWREGRGMVCVYMTRLRDVDDRLVTPEQARSLARKLLQAADTAERHARRASTRGVKRNG